MADLFDGYPVGAAWDEMVAPDGTPRAPYRLLHEHLQRSGAQELRAGLDALARTYLNQGVTFDIGGEERPFPLDIVPRVIAEDEWAVVERGVRQRVAALEAFLADVYGPSLPIMFGTDARPRVTAAKRILPVERFGVKVIDV